MVKRGIIDWANITSASTHEAQKHKPTICVTARWNKEKKKQSWSLVAQSITHCVFASFGVPVFGGKLMLWWRCLWKDCSGVLDMSVLVWP
jgi:hypothetical protein